MAKATKTIPLPDGQPGAGAPGEPGAPTPEDAQKALQNELDEAEKEKQRQQQQHDGQHDGVDSGAAGNTDGATKEPGTDGGTADGQPGAGAPGEPGAGEMNAAPIGFDGAATTFTTAEENVYPVFTIIDDGGAPTHASICNAAENEFMVSVCKMVVERAMELQAERNKPVPLTIDEMAAANHKLLETTYGKDFLRAKKGTNQQYFSRSTWNSMGKNKRGWEIVVDEMPEVTAANELDTE